MFDLHLSFLRYQQISGAAPKNIFQQQYIFRFVILNLDLIGLFFNVFFSSRATRLMCSFDVRRSSLPAYCHSPSVIRDKKNLRDTTRLESLGVRVAYQSSQIKQMPRDGQRSSPCQNTLLMSLFPSTSSLPTLLLLTVVPFPVFLLLLDR